MLYDVSAAIPWRQPDELQCTCMRQGGNLTRSEWEEPRDTAHHQLSPDSRQQSMQRPAQLPDDTQQQETSESMTFTGTRPTTAEYHRADELSLPSTT